VSDTRAISGCWWIGGDDCTPRGILPDGSYPTHLYVRMSADGGQTWTLLDDFQLAAGSRRSAGASWSVTAPSTRWASVPCQHRRLQHRLDRARAVNSRRHFVGEAPTSASTVTALSCSRPGSGSLVENERSHLGKERAQGTSGACSLPFCTGHLGLSRYARPPAFQDRGRGRCPAVSPPSSRHTTPAAARDDGFKKRC
jgi:hypothetical protein